MQFELANWWRAYMKLNTSLRIDVSTSFGKKFCKSMINSEFGKTSESKTNRNQNVIVQNARSVILRSQNFHFKSFDIFRERIAAIKIAKKRIYWNKTTIVGACAFYLAKIHVFQLPYTVTKLNFDCKLLYSDKNSSLYRINTIDVFEFIRRQFHISNFPTFVTIHSSTHFSSSSDQIYHPDVYGRNWWCVFSRI